MNFSEAKPIDISRLKPGELKPIFQAMKSGTPEAWRSLGDVIYVSLRREQTMAQVPDVHLAECVVNAVYQLAFSLGGNALYIPKGMNVAGAERELKIRQEFNGQNHAALARKHKLTEVRIRQILAGSAKQTRVKT